MCADIALHDKNDGNPHAHTLYSQILDMRKEVEQAENVRSCIDKLLQEKRGLTQVKKQELGM